jgi:hypothetical protein
MLDQIKTELNTRVRRRIIDTFNFKGLNTEEKINAEFFIEPQKLRFVFHNNPEVGWIFMDVFTDGVRDDDFPGDGDIKLNLTGATVYSLCRTHNINADDIDELKNCIHKSIIEMYDDEYVAYFHISISSVQDLLDTITSILENMIQNKPPRVKNFKDFYESKNYFKK